MSTGTATTTVVKNKTTDRDRAFWSHVESVAAQSRNIRERSSPRRTDSKNEALTHRDAHAHRDDESCS
jgi:hypothetical protein